MLSVLGSNWSSSRDVAIRSPAVEAVRGCGLRGREAASNPCAAVRWLLLGAAVVAGVVTYAHFPESELPGDVRADRVLVLKGERKLILMDGDRSLKAYQIALGRDPRGPKTREGDGRTPEGAYFIDYRKADSAFHKALHISYPNDSDETRARAHGVDPGGLIMIHGIRNGLGLVGRLHRLAD